MPTYVYCLLTASREPPSTLLRGLDAAAVRVVRAGSISAWASDIAESAPAPTIERIRAHDAVVRCALDQQTPLPARFGQTFASDAALIENVRERRDAFIGALERVRGMVEMTVRVCPNAAVHATLPPVRTEGLSGREYLARLRERTRAERAWQDAADLLHRRVAGVVHHLVRAETRSISARPARALAISHLVERGMVAQYRTELDALAGSDARLHLVISGPWAPYSFAEVGRV